VPNRTDTPLSRVDDQLNSLSLPLGPDDMVIFPVSEGSGALNELVRHPGIVLERIGSDVVVVRRVVHGPGCEQVDGQAKK
jgi:hypothetical protein